MAYFLRKLVIQALFAIFFFRHLCAGFREAIGIQKGSKEQKRVKRIPSSTSDKNSATYSIRTSSKAESDDPSVVEQPKPIDDDAAQAVMNDAQVEAAISQMVKAEEERHPDENCITCALYSWSQGYQKTISMPKTWDDYRRSTRTCAVLIKLAAGSQLTRRPRMDKENLWTEGWILYMSGLRKYLAGLSYKPDSDRKDIHEEVVTHPETQRAMHEWQWTMMMCAKVIQIADDEMRDKLVACSEDVSTLHENLESHKESFAGIPFPGQRQQHTPKYFTSEKCAAFPLTPEQSAPFVDFIMAQPSCSPGSKRKMCKGFSHDSFPFDINRRGVIKKNVQEALARARETNKYHPILGFMGLEMWHNSSGLEQSSGSSGLVEVYQNASGSLQSRWLLSLLTQRLKNMCLKVLALPLQGVYYVLYGTFYIMLNVIRSIAGFWIHDSRLTKRGFVRFPWCWLPFMSTVSERTFNQACYGAPW